MNPSLPAGRAPLGAPADRTASHGSQLVRGLLFAAIPGLAILGWAILGPLLGQDGAARMLLVVGAGVVLARLCLSIVASLKAGEFGLDIIAALAMAGALAAGEYLAGTVVALMYAGGQALEDFAQDRAGREMTALLARVPRSARRMAQGRIEEIAIAAIATGDRLLIAAGEILPVDATLASPNGVFDEAAMTGEPLPVNRCAGDSLSSGIVNAGAAVEIVAIRPAAESTYAGIVRLVEAARRSKAPMARLADRYALGFLALTVTMAGGAWAWSGDPLRGLAVLVIATPCPLILAVPVAMVAGLSRAAGRGILVKSGRALEGLARVRRLIVDKTGTLTHGEARLSHVVTTTDMAQEPILRLAAGLAQASRHPVSRALVAEAQRQGLVPPAPSDVTEQAGAGVTGMVEGHAVVIGSPAFVAARSGSAMTAHAMPAAGDTHLAVAIDGRPVAVLVMRDAVRDETRRTLAALRGHGIERIVLVTGDQDAVAGPMARDLALDGYEADVSPQGKIDAVAREAQAGPTLMIGDGLNDAAALARADIGVALGARGSAGAAEAADVVILVDRLDRVADAIEIARHTRRIALQSVTVGIGLSFCGMVLAAAGLLPPLAGALAQEAIDIAVILNALRALGGATNRP